MKIEFTKEQYRTLMKAVYLGNWMANAHREEDDGLEDDKIKEFDDLQYYIFSHAKDFDLEKYADDKKVGDGKFYPTMDFIKESKVHDLRLDYEHESLWGTLLEEMIGIEFSRNYDSEDFADMNDEQKDNADRKFRKKYEEEFEKNGLRRLGIIE